MAYSILTYCSSGYRGCLDFSLPSWIDSPARSIWIYTDGPVRLPGHPKIAEPTFFFSREMDWGGHCARKAEALDAFLEAQPEGGCCLLLDADCRLVNDPGGVFDLPFDVAVTLPATDDGVEVLPRSFAGRRSKMWNDVSSGVVFVRNTPAARQFVSRWVAEQTLTAEASLRGGRVLPANRDQQALSRGCREFRLSGRARVLAVNAGLYNSFANCRLPVPQAEWLAEIARLRGRIRILHFAFGQWRDEDLVRRAMAAVTGRL